MFLQFIFLMNISPISPVPSPAIAVFWHKLRQFIKRRIKRNIAPAGLIDPQSVIEKYSLEELCESADGYYKSIVNPFPQMGKPFSTVSDAPDLLISMGQLLAGLSLGKTMKILEFGAGVCWFSRFLNQMECSTISCDTSATALEIGKRLFREYPIIGSYLEEPQFLVFDGRKINLPDNSIDRIVCFDTFHHVPNQEAVLSEFWRVLKTDGIAGFSEPGRHHSQAPQSQYEMANFKVLENDVDLDSIFKMARDIGFVHCHATVQQLHKTIFFLHKGNTRPDSRGNVGLAGVLKAEKQHYNVKKNSPLRINVEVLNSGGAKWLSRNIKDIGVVRLGGHLYDANRNLIDLDFGRGDYFSRDIMPLESASTSITVTFPEAGKFCVLLDLVSESICWFENVGSKPIQIEVVVE